MKSWTQPTAEEIRRVQALASRPENRAYFFDRLDNPHWVVPLSSAGFFVDPPSPVPAEEPGYVRFPPWPEGRYLARVASAVPVDVTNVLEEVPSSDNPTVTRALLEAAASLPNTQLRRLSEKVLQWLDKPFAEHFADAAAAVITRYLEAKQVRTALSATAVLLAIQPDPRLAEKAAHADGPLRPHPEATARVSEWQYERLLRQLLTRIIDVTGLEGVKLVVSLLDDALLMSRWSDEVVDNHSNIWRPAIEDHEQNLNVGIKNVLVSATRDAAMSLARRGEDELIAVIRELEAGSVLHRRIALYVLSSTTGVAPLVNEKVGDRNLFDDHRLRHEYAALLRNRFGDAAEGVQTRIIGWIREGPDLQRYRERYARVDGSPPPAAEVDHYARSWRRDWYSFIADYLTGVNADEYQELVRDLGEAEHPDFLSWHTSWSGPESPASQDDLLEKSPAEAVDYLRSWVPEDESGWHFGPSVEGLGRVFSEVVKERAAAYADIADQLAGLDPTYVRAYFSGLRSALQDGTSFTWDKPLELAAFAVWQPFEPDEDTPDRDRDPGWRWCRGEVASLLRSGFADSDNRIPFRLRDSAWQLVERLTRDPNPSPEHERRYGGDNMDPLTLSINTNRGTAIHAVVEYALWTRRELQAAGEDITIGFAAMPEVRTTLETHLKPEREPSLAVRAVYGRWLPWLLLLDEQWVVDHVNKIVPANLELSTLEETVWSTYITWCPPYDSVFRVLTDQYQAAVRRVPSGAMAGTFDRASVDAKLGEHLVTFFWRGLTDTFLLNEFFRRADDELASDVMEFVGRALRNTEGELDPEIQRRIQELWNHRLAVAEADPDAHRLEAKAFGMTFAAAKLERAWSLEALERSIAAAGAPRLDFLVVEELARIVESQPAAATRILAAMLTQPENEWDYIAWRDEARAIVKQTAAIDEPYIAESRATIVDFYVRHGELDFRNLLTRSPHPGEDG